jgi:hypothetical protein
MWGVLGEFPGAWSRKTHGRVKEQPQQGGITWKQQTRSHQPQWFWTLGGVQWHQITVDLHLANYEWCRIHLHELIANKTGFLNRNLNVKIIHLAINKNLHVKPWHINTNWKYVWENINRDYLIYWDCRWFFPFCLLVVSSMTVSWNKKIIWSKKITGRENQMWHSA